PEGRFPARAEAFQVDLRNLVVATSSGALANAGGERLKGGEFETRFQADTDTVVAANLAFHDARFSQYLFFDSVANAQVNVAGKRLPLAPRWLASAGMLYTP